MRLLTRCFAFLFSLQPREGAWAHDRYDGDEPPYDEPPYDAGRPPRRREADEAASAAAVAPERVAACVPCLMLAPMHAQR